MIQAAETRQVHQNKRQLEGTPTAVLWDIHIGELTGGLRFPKINPNRAHPLLPHRLIGEPEGMPGIFVYLQQSDAVLQSLQDLPRSINHLGGGFRVGSQVGLGNTARIQFLDPLSIRGGERPQHACKIRVPGFGERLHIRD